MRRRFTHAANLTFCLFMCSLYVLTLFFLALFFFYCAENDNNSNNNVSSILFFFFKGTLGKGKQTYYVCTECSLISGIYFNPHLVDWDIFSKLLCGWNKWTEKRSFLYNIQKKEKKRKCGNDVRSQSVCIPLKPNIYIDRTVKSNRMLLQADLLGNRYLKTISALKLTFFCF